MLLTVMMFVWLIQGTYRADRDTQMTAERDRRILELRSLTVNLTELLDISARLAAVTGDQRWERRYHELDTELDAALAQSIRLVPDSYGVESSGQFESAHQALSEVRRQVFSLSRRGLLEQARSTLDGEDYEKHRTTHAQGLETLLSAMGDGAHAGFLVRERNSLLERSAAAAAVGLLLVLWLAVLKRRLNEEERLRTARTEELLSSIASVLIGVGTDGRITNWNAAAAALFGIPVEDAIGHPFRECGIRWDWPTILEGVSASVEQNRPVRIETIRFERPAGGEGILGATVNPAARGARSGTSFLLLAADLTEQVDLENQLLQAQKLESVGQLAAGIAHEINTPTQYVGDNTRFLQESFGEVLEFTREIDALTKETPAEADSSKLTAEIRKAMDKIDLAYLSKEIPQAIQQALEGIERVTKIVRAMKEFSHPMREKTAIDINRAIESTITVARNEWKYVAEMVTELDPELPLVCCMPGEFNQVILNLIVNAAHAIRDVVKDGSPSKGTITVSTRQADGWLEIGVADTGTGIPDKIRDKIFDPFFTTKEVGEGTGQGLSLVHSVVVKKHGGKVSVESEMGKGTSFLIRLPMDEPATADLEKTA